MMPTSFYFAPMNRKSRVLALLVALSILTGYLLSKASWVGRTGINLFYKQYKFLKVWWQAGAVVLGVWMLFFFVQGLLQKRLPPHKAKWVHLTAILFALLGLFFTYQDFRNNLSHRLLGERFHLGSYLFWVGWLIISISYLVQKREAAPAA